MNRSLCFFLAAFLCSATVNAKSLPTIENMKASLEKANVASKSEWEDKKSAQGLSYSIATKNGQLVVLNKDQMVVMRNVSSGADKVKQVQSAFENCQDVAKAIMGGTSDEQYNLIGGIINASAKVPGFTVSNLVNGYEFNSQVIQNSNGMTLNCGIKETRV
ncbi:hypothetical protein LJL11_003024 [Serratia marcescens]|nr:hypothetical protein [Serratia marcescens]